MFRKHVEVAPRDANSHDSLGEALLAKGSTDEALASYLKALSLDASFAASLQGAAKCYDRKGMKSEAAKRYRQYADAYPTARDAKAARERADELEGKWLPSDLIVPASEPWRGGAGCQSQPTAPARTSA